MNKAVDSLALQPVYQKLAELVGEDAMLKVFDYYKGNQISFPGHLYNRETASKQIRKRFDGHNQAELVRYYGYSQRWVTRIIAEKN